MRFDAAPMPFLRDIMYLLNVLCTARNSTWCQHAMQHFDAGQTREERAEVFSREKRKKNGACRGGEEEVQEPAQYSDPGSESRLERERRRNKKRQDTRKDGKKNTAYK